MRLVLIYFILSATAYAGDINQVFSCKLGENRFAMHLGENGDAEVGDGTESFSGSYSYNDGIEFQFPELGYQDKSLSVEKKGLHNDFSHSNFILSRDCARERWRITREG